MERSLAIFMQQLKLREIEVEKDFQEDLPLVLANNNRLEQVFINLLINARDAIEDKCEKFGDTIEKRIFLKTRLWQGKVRIEVADTRVRDSQTVAGKDIRAILHHKAGWQGYRTRPFDKLWNHSGL